MLSGYLYGRIRSGGGYFCFQEFVKKKVLRVLLPYIVWAGVVIWLQGRQWISLLQGVSHLWFLLFIFEAYISFRLIDKYLNSNTWKWFVIGSFVLLLIANKLSILVPCPLLGVEKYLCYMPYYVLGACISIDKQRDDSKTVLPLLLSFILMLSVFLVTDRYVMLAIPGVFLSLSIFRFALSFNVSTMPRILQNLDKCSMGIYLIHHIIIQQANASTIIHPFMQEHARWYPVVMFMIVLPISWVLTNLGKKTRLGNMLLG